MESAHCYLNMVPEMKVGSTVIYRSPGLILTGTVEEIGGDCARVRLSSPWGVPCAFSEWLPMAALGVAIHHEQDTRPREG